MRVIDLSWDEECRVCDGSGFLQKSDIFFEEYADKFTYTCTKCNGCQRQMTQKGRELVTFLKGA